MMKAFCRSGDIHILCHEWGMCSSEHLAHCQPIPRVLVPAASDTYSTGFPITGPCLYCAWEQCKEMYFFTFISLAECFDRPTCLVKVFCLCNLKGSNHLVKTNQHKSSVWILIFSLLAFDPGIQEYWLFSQFIYQLLFPLLVTVQVSIKNYHP